MSTGWKYFTLNETGIACVNKTGWTKLCVRTTEDVLDNAPTDGHYASFYSSESGSGNNPYLLITYGVEERKIIFIDD